MNSEVFAALNVAVKGTSDEGAGKESAGGLDASMNPDTRSKPSSRRHVFKLLGGEFFSHPDALSGNRMDKSASDSDVVYMEKDGGFTSPTPFTYSWQETGKDSKGFTFTYLKVSPSKLDAMDGTSRMIPESRIKNGNKSEEFGKNLEKVVATNIDGKPTPTSMSPMSVPSISSLQLSLTQSLPSPCIKKMKPTFQEEKECSRDA